MAETRTAGVLGGPGGPVAGQGPGRRRNHDSMIVPGRGSRRQPQPRPGSRVLSPARQASDSDSSDRDSARQPGRACVLPLARPRSGQARLGSRPAVDPVNLKFNPAGVTVARPAAWQLGQPVCNLE